ncbi:MAG: hypothetical protein Kapaf2KO_12620 [Candidatus Kapaibacteriales bacterium]
MSINLKIIISVLLIFSFTQAHSDVTAAEGFYVKGESSEEGYTFTLPNIPETTQQSVLRYHYGIGGFIPYLQFDSKDKESHVYTIPKDSISDSHLEPTILRIERRSIFGSGQNVDERNEFTYLFPKHEAPPIEDKNIRYHLVLVDYTIYDDLQSELEEYVELLNMRGYEVIIKTAPRAEEYDSKLVQATKSIIKSVYNQVEEDTNTKLYSVMLLGRIPIPYSGGYTIDGHEPDHVGAWPADTYYGDMDENWTDSEEDLSIAAWERMYNVPGDGKFDQEIIPGKLELAVGRVDFFDLPYFAETELELYRGYLNKVNRYRKPYDRLDGDQSFLQEKMNAIWQDDWNIYGPGFPGFTMRSFFGTMVGEDNIELGNIQFRPKEKDFTFGHGGGSGGSKSVHAIAYAQEYGLDEYKIKFNQFFGSFVGDIDFEDQIMRAVIANKGNTLTCNFGGRPLWINQNMVNGEMIGESFLRTTGNADKDFEGMGNYYAGGIHILLLGDPTLRAGEQNAIGASYPLSQPGAQGSSFYLTDFEGVDSIYIYSRPDGAGEGTYVFDRAIEQKKGEFIEDIEVGEVIRARYKVVNNMGSHYRLSVPVLVEEFKSVEDFNQRSDFYATEYGSIFLKGSSILSGTALLEVVDFSGRVIFSEYLNSDKLDFGYEIGNTNSLRNGLYMIRLSDNKGLSLQTKMLLNR